MEGIQIDEIEPYVFIDQVLKINVKLSIPLTNQLIAAGGSLSLKILSGYEDISVTNSTHREYRTDLLEVVDHTDFTTDGKSTAYVKFKQVSADHNNKKFVICFQVYNLQGTANIITGFSNPVICVRHKLKIEEIEQQTEPYVWYKDEGGRDKSIDYTIKLVDSDGKVVTKRLVPLRVLLIYRGGQVVQHQNILVLSPDSVACISGPDNTEFGITKIKIRINEVSTRHRGQPFQIQVSPNLDLADEIGDIAPAESYAIDVKSKRNSSKKNQDYSDYPSKRPRLSEQIKRPMLSDFPRSEGLVQSHEEAISAMRSLIPWVETVLSHVQKMRWQPLGYERIPRGFDSYDMDSRALHSFIKPNDLIDDILQRYEAEGRASLSSLLSYLENEDVIRALNQAATPSEDNENSEINAPNRLTVRTKADIEAANGLIQRTIGDSRESRTRGKF